MSQLREGFRQTWTFIDNLNPTYFSESSKNLALHTFNRLDPVLDFTDIDKQNFIHFPAQVFSP